jgi:hypothetical protein
MSSKNKAAHRNIKRRITRDLKIQIIDAFAGPRIEELLQMDRHQKSRAPFPIELPYESYAEFYRLQDPQYTPPFLPEELLVICAISHYVRAQLSTMLNKLEKLDGVEYWVTRGLLERCISDNYDALVVILRERWPQEHASILRKKGRLQTPAGVLWSIFLRTFFARGKNYSH